MAVAAVGECFNYLFDRRNTREELARLFGQIHQALNRDGLLLFDVAEPGRVPGGGPIRFFVDQPDWAVLVVSEEDPTSRLLTRRITTFRRIGDLYRRDQEIHRQRAYPAIRTDEATPRPRLPGTNPSRLWSDTLSAGCRGDPGKEDLTQPAEKITSILAISGASRTAAHSTRRTC